MLCHLFLCMQIQLVLPMHDTELQAQLLGGMRAWASTASHVRAIATTEKARGMRRDQTVTRSVLLIFRGMPAQGLTAHTCQ
jgi:hypothetical protein